MAFQTPIASTFIKASSSPRLLGIGMPSLILWFPLLKLQKIVLLSSLLWWELGTDFPRSQVLMSDCHFGVSPVNYSDSDGFCILDSHFLHWPLLLWGWGVGVEGGGGYLISIAYCPFFHCISTSRSLMGHINKYLCLLLILLHFHQKCFKKCILC